MSTYTPIATQTLGSAAASVTFSSIPQGYTDLVLIANRSSSGIDNLSMQFNGDTGSNYSFTVLYGTGSTAGSARGSNTNNPYLDYYASSNSSLPTPVIMNIQNYSNSTTYKTTLARGNAAATGVDATVMLWRNTSAITSILLKCHDGSNFTTGSTFSIYGIQVGDKAQKAQGGNIVTSDGTYVYHTFTSSGSFIPSAALTVDYLVVAGGGAGGLLLGGGGGAGGLRSTVTATGGGGSLESSLSLSSGLSYPVIIGAGASALTANGQQITVSGSNSIFGSITSIGGGGGGSANGGNLSNGASGGSGGGGGGGAGASGGARTSSPVQGYAGGISLGTWGYSEIGGGGGGGAGAVGADSGIAGANGGAGGNGVQITALATATGTGVSGYYAGGGGGWGSNGSRSAGGLGGGGGGGTYPSPNSGISGTINTGSGGGGTYPTTSGSTGGNGGSGIVIIRYLA